MAQDERDLEAADRSWDELIGELRIVLTGVAVLFSVLLTVPFSANFDDDDFQTGVYLAALLLSAGSGITLIAPVAYHRIGYNREEKPRVVTRSNRLAIVGLVLLALAIGAVVMLVLDVLVARWVAVAVSTGLAVTAGLLWFLPATVQGND